VICVLLAALLLLCSYIIGKNELFLLLNTDLGPVGNTFFQYFTYLGDGALWVLWIAWIISKKQKQLWPLIISAFALTTIFTQVFKYFILPDELRPARAIADIAQIHFVEGVTVHGYSSFPSGHTATAFTLVFSVGRLF